MPYQPTTNFKDSNGIDLGKKLVNKEYLSEVYLSILESIGNSGLTVTPALWNWGYNNAGQLGNNNTSNSPTPITTLIGRTDWKQVSGGFSFTAAIKTDGTLWIWGQNTYGQLGTNDTNVRTTPVTTFAGGTNWNQVACGVFSVAAIKTDGTLWTWGRNNNGQLGINLIGDTNGRSTPVTTLVGGTNWYQVASGTGHTAAIKTDGTLWVWGGTIYGAVGVNDTFQRNTPTQTFIGGADWKQVACGYAHTVAVKTNGTLWTWGLNRYGQLGINNAGDTTCRTTPTTTFIGGTDWKQVSANEWNSAAVKTNGTLWAWGRNNQGQLGINEAGDTTGRSTPVTTLIGGTNWRQVASGSFHTAAIKTNGTLWTWGYNNDGELGINNFTNRTTPVTTFAGGTDWRKVTCSTYNTMAIRPVSDI